MSAYGFPELMFPGEVYVGSVDVDVLINYTKLKDIILFCINGFFMTDDTFNDWCGQLF